jgi:hypothetical protein
LSIASLPIFGNWLITAGIVIEIVAIVLIGYTSLGNALFGTAPIEPGAWLVVVPFAIAMLLLEEARKGLMRSRIRGRPGATSGVAE